jgi:thiosulfate dehydrogenase
MTEPASTKATAKERGLAPIVAACGVVGLLAVGGAIALNGAGASPVATEDYGRRLLSQTSELLGPDHPDPAMRYSGIRLACGSCHLGIGAQPGTLSLLQAAEKYPRFSGRDGRESDMVARINGCMTRSMNGRELSPDSVEMRAMVAYVASLGDRYDAMGASLRKAVESSAFVTPARAANVDAGGQVFRERCALCHGSDGLGLLATPQRAKGYTFPPLWGPDSFNNGAGMHRVLTAARFIKARMPLGKADLTDDQAFDVAAYINSKPRPQMANLERDYPDRTTKPVDTPYGPFADDFPMEQHRLGPFQPIEAHYKSLKAAK